MESSAERAYRLGCNTFQIFSSSPRMWRPYTIAASQCEAMSDLRNVGVEILTLGQYLRPTAAHLPVARWWRPEEFDELRAAGEEMGGKGMA